jgi:hypothetical protein
MGISEEPIAAELMANIRGCAKDALAVLGSKYARAEPATIVEAIDDFAHRWQQGDRPPRKVVKDTEQARLIFGSLWGEQLVKQFGWQWTKVLFADDDGFAFGVVAPDRSLAIYPLDFMLGCMEDATVDVTVALSFNMLLEGTVPKMRPRGYTNLMDGVHRIVPRD